MGAAVFSPALHRLGGRSTTDTTWCLQIHITYNSPSSVTISWATGQGLQFAKPVTSYASDDGIQTEVYYGTMSGMYSNNATG